MTEQHILIGTVAKGSGLGNGLEALIRTDYRKDTDEVRNHVASIMEQARSFSISSAPLNVDFVHEVEPQDLRNLRRYRVTLQLASHSFVYHSVEKLKLDGDGLTLGLRVLLRPDDETRLNLAPFAGHYDEETGTMLFTNFIKRKRLVGSVFTREHMRPENLAILRAKQDAAINLAVEAITGITPTDEGVFSRPLMRKDHSPQPVDVLA